MTATATSAVRMMTIMRIVSLVIDPATVLTDAPNRNKDHPRSGHGKNVEDSGKQRQREESIMTTMMIRNIYQDEELRNLRVVGVLPGEDAKKNTKKQSAQS